MRFPKWVSILALLLTLPLRQGFAQGDRSMEDRLRRLEEKIAEQQKLIESQAQAIEELKKAQHPGTVEVKPSEPAPAPVKEPSKEGVSVSASFKDGLKIRSADDNFTLDIGGRLIFQSRTFTSQNPGDSTFFNREARLQMEGTFYKQWGYKVQYDIVPATSLGVTGTSTASENGSARLREGFVDWRRWPQLSVRAGQWKEPFSLQQVTSSRFIDFVERSVCDRLTPSYDVGIAAYGKAWDPYLSYEIGIFNGNGFNTRDTNDDKDVAARIVLKPFASPENKSVWTRGLQLGIAFTDGNQEGTFGSITSPSTGTSFLQSNAGTVARGGRQRWGGELAWLIGPFKMQGEYMTSRIELKRPSVSSVSEEFDFDGWYVQALYVLTGEDAQLLRRKPATRFLEDGGCGQWEIAARYGHFGVDNDFFDTLASGGIAAATKTGGTASTDGVDEWTIGLNWWPNPNTRLSVNWVRNEFDDKVGFGTGVGALDSEDAVLFRMQLEF